MNTYEVRSIDGTTCCIIEADNLLIDDDSICLYNEIPCKADVEVLAVFPKLHFYVVKNKKND